MAKLGPEFIGKLPPDALEILNSTLKDFDVHFKDGILKGVEILGCNNCALSMAQKGKVYNPSEVPSLPLPGCSRSPCCGCDYGPVVR